jgi:hypothetical protein
MKIEIEKSMITWAVVRGIIPILSLVVTVSLGATTMSAHGESRETSSSAAAFNQLASLVGEWEAFQDGVPIEETYTLTTNGTALMWETKPANSAPMITMFTVDGDHLIATHYCVAEKQPQMVTGVPGDLEKNGMTFSLARVTGMKPADDWHIQD